MLTKNIPVITVDGPSGTGKGTISHLIADHLKWNVLDSGALYRVLAYAAVTKSIDLKDIDALVRLALDLNIHFELDETLHSRVFLEHIDIQKPIREETCGQNASTIAAIPEIRSALLERQRMFAKPPGLVTDGRDMGTVVFPNAVLKIFLYASPEERARRRYTQLKDAGIHVSLPHVVEELTKRDERDSSRQVAPLKAATDAVYIDTTGLSIQQVFSQVISLIHERNIVAG